MNNTQERYRQDTSVLGNLNHDRVSEYLRAEYGRGMLEMLIKNSPWQTFGTMTVAPSYGGRELDEQSGMSSEAMKKLMFKFFSRRPLRSVKYFWVIERHFPERFGGKGGTHAHFLTKDEKGINWRKCWKWWHETKGYGRFETRRVNYDKILKLAAYLSKYCVKDAASSDWGQERFGPTPLVLERQIATPTGPFVATGSAEHAAMERETFDWSKKIRMRKPMIRI